MIPITSLSAIDTQRAFTENAVLSFEDSTIGNRVLGFRQNDSPLETAAGLEFYKENVLQDQRVRHVMEAIVPLSRLELYEIYHADSDRIYTFMEGRDAEMKAVVIQLWSPQSRMDVYKGSHMLPLRKFTGSNGLFDISDDASLQQCRAESVEFIKGGLSILDARVAFKPVKGSSVHLVFVTRENRVGLGGCDFTSLAGACCFL